MHEGVALRPVHPNLAIVSRIAGAGCDEFERLEHAPGPAQADRYRAEALAVDGRTIYLSAPGIGIVTHAFTLFRPR